MLLFYIKTFDSTYVHMYIFTFVPINNQRSFDEVQV